MKYKDLIVWQKSHALSLKTFNAMKFIKPSYTAEVIIKQLLRSVTSIGANIAEGYGRYEGKEYIRFLRIAYGSSTETDNWLTLLADAGLISTEIASELIKDNEEVLKILTTMIKKIKENSSG
jgi:four helix bundle protein